MKKNRRNKFEKSTGVPDPTAGSVDERVAADMTQT